MGRLKIISVLILCFFASAVFAAGDSVMQLQQEKFIAGSYKNFYVDDFGNIFLISNNNQVKKLNANGDSITVFNDKRRYGDIYSMDINNPLKLFVYYKDFVTIVALDRFLNPLNTIDFRKDNILQATAVAQSYDNNYWLFDELDNKLKKIDGQGNILLESADFRVLFSDSYYPSEIIDKSGVLYLYNAKQGWKIFDYYGAFKQNLAYTNWNDVQTTGKILSGHDSTFFYTADIKIPGIKKIKPNIDISDTIKIQQQQNKIFVMRKEGLYIYSMHN